MKLFEHYHGPLNVEVIDGGGYKLIRDFTATVRVDGLFYAVYVPFGFETDFASVPVFKAAWSSRRAAVIHDYLYRSPASNPHIARLAADKAFYRCLLLSGMSRWKAKVYYAAVRAFGGRRWNQIRYIS